MTWRVCVCKTITWWWIYFRTIRVLVNKMFRKFMFLKFHCCNWCARLQLGKDRNCNLKQRKAEKWKRNRLELVGKDSESIVPSCELYQSADQQIKENRPWPIFRGCHQKVCMQEEEKIVFFFFLIIYTKHNEHLQIARNNWIVK